MQRSTKKACHESFNRKKANPFRLQAATSWTISWRTYFSSSAACKSCSSGDSPYCPTGTEAGVRRGGQGPAARGLSTAVLCGRSRRVLFTVYTLLIAVRAGGGSTLSVSLSSIAALGKRSHWFVHKTTSAQKHNAQYVIVRNTGLKPILAIGQNYIVLAI